MINMFIIYIFFFVIVLLLIYRVNAVVGGSLYILDEDLREADSKENIEFIHVPNDHVEGLYQSNLRMKIGKLPNMEDGRRQPICRSR